MWREREFDMFEIKHFSDSELWILKVSKCFIFPNFAAFILGFHSVSVPKPVQHQFAEIARGRREQPKQIAWILFAKVIESEC